MERLIRIACLEAIKTIKGYVLRSNAGRLKVCERYGFAAKESPGDPLIEMALSVGTDRA